MASMANAFASEKLKIRKAGAAMPNGSRSSPVSSDIRLRRPDRHEAAAAHAVSKHAVFVRNHSTQAAGVVGWVHVSVAHLLESDTGPK